jgi:RNA polymerase sigma-70 factor (ECF subfamily)
LVRLHQRRIYRVLLAIVRDPDAADTLTQECFLRAYEKRASFRGEAKVETWLVRIAMNLARDHAKNRRQSFWRRLVAWAKDEDSMKQAARVADRQS